MKRVDKSQPLVSVVMPLYNNEKYVHEAILSVQRQIYHNWELIIVDDGSSDQCYDVAKLMAKNDKRIRLYRNRKNVGIGETMNRLLTLVRGEYIARMDSDDLMLPTRLLTQVRYLASNPEVGVIGSYLAEINGRRQLVAVRKVPTEHGQIVQGFLTRQTIQNPTLMLRVKMIPENELHFDGSFSPVDDLEFYLRLSRKGVKFANLPEYLMYYRAHGANSSLSDIKKSFALTKLVRKQALSKSKTELIFRQRITSNLQDWVVTLLPNQILYTIYKLWQGSWVRGGLVPVVGPKREYGVSLVMPVYQGENLIKESIERVIVAVRALGRPFELIVVVDGEVDKAAQIIARLRVKYPELKIITYSENCGKGYAVRKGMECAQFEYVGYVDAGHDIGINSLVTMIESLNDLPATDMIVADKTHPMSQIINVPYYRRLYSAIFRMVVKILLGMKMGDTQVGLKLLRREVITSMDTNWRVNGFAFDVELMYNMLSQGKNITRLPVMIKKNGETSTVTFRDMLTMLTDLLRIKIENLVRQMELGKGRSYYSIMDR